VDELERDVKYGLGPMAPSELDRGVSYQNNMEPSPTVAIRALTLLAGSCGFLFDRLLESTDFR